MPLSADYTEVLESAHLWNSFIRRLRYGVDSALACGDLMQLSRDKVVLITPPSTAVELEIAIGDLRLM